jgi:hypothetical protein
MSWENMAGDGRIRYCQECKLSVYNLSDMARAEAERLIANHEGRLCVRFYRRSDGTILTRDCPRGLRALSERVSRFAGTVLAAMMTVSSAVAKTPAGKTTPHQAQSEQAHLGLNVTVVDPTGALIPNARVELCDCKEHTRTIVITDPSGVAHFAGLLKGSYELEIQMQGFRNNRTNVTVKKMEQIQVKLKIAPTTTTVVVNALPVEVMGTVGMVITTEHLPLPPVSSGTGHGTLR